MPAWSLAFSLGGSIDFSLESIGHSFDHYYKYHYSPMPMESSPTNPEVGTEAREVDMEVQQENEREVQMMEGTQNGMTRTSGALGRQVEKRGTSGGPASKVKDSRDIPTGKECNVCGAGDHHTWACTRIRSQPDLNAYLICRLQLVWNSWKLRRRLSNDQRDPKCTHLRLSPCQPCSISLICNGRIEP